MFRADTPIWIGPGSGTPGAEVNEPLTWSRVGSHSTSNGTVWLPGTTVSGPVVFQSAEDGPTSAVAWNVTAVCGNVRVTAYWPSTPMPTNTRWNQISVPPSSNACRRTKAPVP